MTDNLMRAFSEASDLERQAFLAVMVKHDTVNETYKGLKMYENEKKAEEAKKQAYERGFAARDEAAAKFNKMFPNT